MNWEVVTNIYPFLLGGAVITLEISVLAIILGTSFGFLMTLMRMSHNKLFRAFAFVFTWLFRGIPLLVILFWAYYATPFGIKLTAFQAGLLAMTLNATAYFAEIIRAGMQAIDKGQIEAAEAVGMNPWQIMWRIRIPQVIRIILPPFISNSIALLKGSSQVSVITVSDLMLRAQTQYSSTYLPVETLGLAALFYLLMTSCLMALQTWTEKKMKISGAGH